MRILEILLPKNTNDRDLAPQTARKIDVLQKRMDGFVDKITDPKTAPQAREFLKTKLRNDYHELKKHISSIHPVSEAVHRVPLSNNDFELLAKLMEKPIPAGIAPIYINDLIDDDEFNQQLECFDPGMDVRPYIAEWVNRVMPDQMYRFDDNRVDKSDRNGKMSIIHGYDPHQYKGQSMEVTGNNAFGRT